jgi:hypothetical protein
METGGDERVRARYHDQVRQMPLHDVPISPVVHAKIGDIATVCDCAFQELDPAKATYF